MWKFDAASSLLPVAVLASIGKTPAHGYEIRQRQSENGFGEFKGGTIYPLLKRLEEAELVTATWDIPGTGPTRKVYELSQAGKEIVDKEINNIERLLNVIKAFSEGN
ncbi:PadR family transcriptional regulator [Corynebacterium casei]|uniref:PadR family transcriptional regulator n=1 Tax=Corynebacterium casei TaxID=160386 RepID=UPI003F917285